MKTAPKFSLSSHPIIQQGNFRGGLPLTSLKVQACAGLIFTFQKYL